MKSKIETAASVTRLDHVAIAVTNLDQYQKVFEDIGVEFSPHRETVESQNVNVAFADVGAFAKIELVTPSNATGPIQRFLEKKGSGIHHLCFSVPDVAATCESLKKKGYQILYSSPRQGAKNCLVNFIHPKSTGGLLIELSSQS